MKPADQGGGGAEDVEVPQTSNSLFLSLNCSTRLPQRTSAELRVGERANWNWQQVPNTLSLHLFSAASLGARRYLLRRRESSSTWAQCVSACVSPIMLYRVKASLVLMLKHTHQLKWDTGWSSGKTAEQTDLNTVAVLLFDWSLQHCSTILFYVWFKLVC